MPKIEDCIKNNQKKKFIPGRFRAWDFNESLLSESSNTNEKNISLNHTTELPKETQTNTQTRYKGTHNSGTNEPTAMCPKDKVLGTKETQADTQTGYKLTHKPGTEKAPKRTFYSLTGNSRKVMTLIYQSCLINKSNVSPSLSRDFISSSCQINKNSIKTVIDRLVDANLLIRNFYRTSKNGGTEYCIPEKIIDEIKHLESIGKLHYVFNANILQQYDLGTNEPTTSNVSSSYINTTTNIPKELLLINCTPLEKIGFSQKNIIQIYREYEKKPNLALSAEIIQESIDSLSFDLKHNEAEKRFNHSPATVLTSLLKQGKPYISTTPDKFRTPQQEAMDEYLAVKEKQKKLEKEVELKIKQLEFEEWQNNLPEDELLEFCPDSEISEGVPTKLRKTMRRRKALELSKDYFETEIWPSRKEKILKVKEEV